MGEENKPRGNNIIFYIVIPNLFVQLETLKQVQGDIDLFARFEIPKQVRNDCTVITKIRSSE